MSVDFFDTDPSTGEPIENTPTWAEQLHVMNKSKRALYASTAVLLICAFIALVLACVTLARLSSGGDTTENAFLGAIIAMTILVLGSGCAQIVIFKEKDIIMSI